MRIRYQTKRFSSDKLAVIDAANAIILEYQKSGFSLTLRQLFYQFVSRGFIPNTEKAYNRLGVIIVDGRLGGLIDWEAIEDRTRFVRETTFWDNPEGVIKAAARAYKVDKWQGQKFRPEVWIEKDALVGVIEGVCTENDVSYFSCRGYTSISEMWRAAQRHRKILQGRQVPVVLYLGDHDPSGMDITRVVETKLALFVGIEVPVVRLALNMEQVEEFNPPPNPTKLTDSRAKGYVAAYGYDSWELDAMDPAYLASIIQKAINKFKKHALWRMTVKRETEQRQQIEAIVENYNAVAALMEDLRAY